MADSTTALLSNSVSAEHYSSLEEMIERCIGDCGWRQFLQVMLVNLAWIFDAQQVFISIFTDAQPTWHCIEPLVSRANASCNPNICLLPRSSWSWDLPAHTSIISEWSLECAGSVVTGLPASSFFLGCLAGGFVLVTLADSSLGRKNTILLSCLVMSVAGLLTTISNNIWVYSMFRFISGFGRATLGTCSLVLGSELVGKRWRGQVGIIGYLGFMLGFLSLPGIAYLNRGSSWRVLYLWTCIPAVLYCVLVYFFVRESPRWLFVQGREEEFVKTLKSISPPNKRRNLGLIIFSEMSIENQSQKVDVYSAIKILFERKWAIRRLAAAMALAFGIGLVYYGIPLGVGNLNFNLYLSTMLNALSELPATIVTSFLIAKLNRRSALLGFTLLSGFAVCVCAMTRSSKWRGVHIGMELLSFFSACTALDVLLIYALELFPTCIRNSAVSIVRQVLVSGAVFSPLLVAAGRGNEILSYGVFGLTIGISGLFVGCLPETRGKTLCDTMDDEEQEETATTSITQNRGGGVV